MKYYGLIGFAEYQETTPGVWEEVISAHPYYGDVLINIRRFEPSGEKLHDDLTINNRISIVADAYAFQNFHNMKYIEWQGAKWKIRTVTVERPRLILEVGGVYNGPQT